MSSRADRGRITPLAVEIFCVIAVVAVGLIAAWPLRGPGLVASADGELHLYRVFALDRALQQGIFFPRVLPDLLFGYGYPLFNFYPPASTYLVELLHLMGFGFLAALRLAYGASFVLAGLAMYAFARTTFGAPSESSTRLRAASLLAALAYVLAPYFLINVYTRGALAEALAMALFPALLLAGHHAVAARGRQAPFALAFLTALLVLTHSALAIFFLPIVAVYGMVVARAATPGLSWRGLLSCLGTLALGLAMSAFFWLPAALDRGYVNTGNLETGFYDIHRNFFALSDLVARTLFYPPTAPLPIPPRLGLLQLLLALAALPLLARRRANRLVLGYWVAVAVAALFLMTPASAPVWDALPFVAGLSFPWRLLAFASLATALLSGSLVLALRPGPALPVALALVAASAVVALPGIAPEHRNIAETEIDLARYWRFEFETSLVGTTSAAEYLPRALSAGSYLLPRAPAEPATTEQDGPSLEATVELLDAGAQRLRLRVAAPTPTAIVAHAVHFPGWQATIDGVPANTYPSTPLGLVTVDVPPGEHELVVGYGESAAARAGDLVSLAAVLATLGALLLRSWPRWLVVGALAPGAGWGARPGESIRAWANETRPAPVSGRARATAGCNRALDGRADQSAPTDYVCSGAVSTAGRSPLLPAPIVKAHQRRLPIFATSPTYAVATVALAVVALVTLSGLVLRPGAAISPPEGGPVALSGDVDLLGSSPAVGHDGLLRFTLYWLARRTPARNEVVVVTLRDGQGAERMRWERQPLAGFTPARRWVAGEVIPDEYALPLPTDLAAGQYAIAVGFRDSARSVAIGNAALLAGRASPARALPAPQQPLDLRIGAGMRLFGYDLAPGATIAPGQTLDVTLYWQSLAVVDRDYTVFLHFVDEKGERRAGQDAQPEDGRRPTLLWQPGDVVVDQHRLTIPADLPPGRYQLRLGAYAAPTMARLDLFDGQGGRLGDSAAIGTVEIR